jgi:hypothetical protein
MFLQYLEQDYIQAYGAIANGGMNDTDLHAITMVFISYTA